ncbi:type II secretion system F family protein [Lacipirellula parvula]|uniref:TadC n=1 Tax=Lacipirellula parvula TaxID=2650471 RepID=A0A5K7X9B5_9BACT|nr:type II secretion system F family protein [Lacipirellula parvula]BBO32955.1 tadC [Lacipirellula parvula]
MEPLLAALVSQSTITQMAVFGAVAAVAWWVLDTMSRSKPRAEQRLEEYREPNSRKSDLLSGKSSKVGAISKVLEKASPALSAPLQPKTEAEVSKVREKLNMAGFRGANAPQMYWSLKILALGAGFFLGGGVMLLTKGVNKDALTYTGIIAGVCFYLPEVILWVIRKGRQDNIFYGLPDALDLMVVCVEAGLGLDQAMRKVTDEMKKTYKVISEEFALSNMQLQMGRARTEVLHDLGSRTGVDDLKALAAILIQADKFGSSVAQALRVQSDSMRTRRRQLAEEKAAKTAVKLIFPLVLFIFPAIFVVLVGPAAITMVNELFPTMGAQ